MIRKGLRFGQVRLNGLNTIRKADQEVRPTVRLTVRLTGGDALEFLEREVKAARGGIQAALEAGEIVPAHAGPGPVFRVVMPPEVGFGFAQAAELPIVVDENIDQDAMLGARGMPALVVLLGKVLEGDGIFAGDGLGFGVNAGFEGIEAGDGLTLKGARAGRL